MLKTGGYLAARVTVAEEEMALCAEWWADALRPSNRAFGIKRKIIQRHHRM